MTGNEQRIYTESFAWSLLSILVYLLFHHFQPVIVNDGQIGDGAQYFGMFNYFRHGVFSNRLGDGLLFPYNQRPLGPYCAALLSKHFLWTASRSFRALHMVSIAVTSWLLYFIFVRYFYFDKLISSLALTWFLFHAFAYTRLTNYFPFIVDSFAMLSLVLLLYIVMSGRYIFLPALAIVGCAIKEQFLAFLIAMLVYESLVAIKRKRIERTKLAIIAISILLDIGVNYWIRHYIFIAPGSSLLTLLLWGYQRFKYPLSFVRYVVVYFVAFGSFGLLLVYYLKNSIKEILQFDSYKLVGLFSLEFIVFGFLAGMDMDRILWNGFPFLMPVMLLAINGFNRKYVLALFLCTVPLMHLITPIPQPLLGQPNNEYNDLSNWMMELANPGIVAMWGLYMFVIWMLIGRLRFLNRNTSTDADGTRREVNVS